MTDEAKTETRVELWSERPGDFYADNLFVTDGGGIGMNVGGNVVIKPLKEWHALSRLSASPLPEEIEWRVSRLRSHADYLDTQKMSLVAIFIRESAAALQQQAREIESLRAGLSSPTVRIQFDMINMQAERIRELEAENERLNKALTLAAQTICDAGGVKNAFATTRDLEARIRELEAERDKWKKASGSGDLADLAQETRAIHDAIRAKTIEECIAECSCSYCADRIHALNQPPEAESE